jgi:hypothetical protein
MNDERLRALLRRWRDVEPPANFETNVRRRIRLATAEASRARWLWRPAFAMAIAASVIFGVTGGVLSSNRPRSEMQFMSAGTLTGGYARLTTEGRK